LIDYGGLFVFCLLFFLGWGFCRYLGALIKSEQGIQGSSSEQLLSTSDTSGSTRSGGGPAGGQDSQSSMLSNLSRLPSMNQSWHSMSSKVPPPPTAAAPPEPKLQNNNNNNSSGILHYHSPQMRGLLGQDFGLLPETSQVTDVTGMSASSQHHHHHHHHQQQQQHQAAAAAAAAYMSNAYGGGAESVGRESEGQPLRHFFDDWPRSSRDQSHTMTWGSAAAGVDESTERSNSDNHHHHHHHHHLIHNPNNNTQLSISIPITTPSSAMTLSAQRPGSPPAGTILFNNLSNFA
jgi:hypothetical protein